MITRNDIDRISPVRSLSTFDRWLVAMFFVSILALFFAVAIILSRRGYGFVLLVALSSGALLLAMERLEIRYIARPIIQWNPLQHYLVPVITICAVTFVAYLPTLKVNFNSDAIAYLHLFHAHSLNQFLRLFHSDLSQGAGGVNIQELRPLYGLSYTVSYSLWHLNPVGYHIDGILLHFINAAAVFLIVRTIAPDSIWRAGFAGLLFALLPANAENLGSINGSLTEAVPTLFYLAAFLCFIVFRRSGLARYLVLSVIAFAACLLSKETSVTLPIMLVSYDLFFIVRGKGLFSAPCNQPGKKSWGRFILPHAPFVTLLFCYLAMRRIVFGSFLKEDTWSNTWGLVAQTKGSRTTDILHLLAQVMRHLGSIHTFNLRNLILPFPVEVQGLVLGLGVVWTLSLLLDRSESRQTIELIIYFGLVWYFISTAPLMASDLSVGHLYLPSTGPCIATAFCAIPISAEVRMRAGYLRRVCALFLVCVCGSTLWAENVHWAHSWGEMLDAPPELPGSLQGLPGKALVVIWIPGGRTAESHWTEEYLPYALQAPFTATDLNSQLSIVETPEVYCCSVSQWWGKTRLTLATQLEGSPEDQSELYLVAWDNRCNCFQRNRRVIARALLRACVTNSLGGPLGQTYSLKSGGADDLIESLARCGETP